MNTIFSTFDLQGTQVENRVAMAPMTRSRTSQPGDVPNDMMAKYYGQRASAGLIITEGAPISAVGRGYSMTPGIYTQAHIDGWKKTTEAVHDQGGKVFIQLWHVGRRSHDSIAGEQPVSASNIKEADKVYGPDVNSETGFGMIETSTPRAMTQADIEQTIADFVQAAKNAMEAGFDGVEIHGAHGYLLDQFMRIDSNQRNDEYGGSMNNRMRFTLDIVNAVSNAIGADKVAIRLSPFVTEGFAKEDPEIVPLTIKLVEQLAPLGLSYIHFSENISNSTEVTEAFRQAVRAVYKHPIMVAGKQTQATANDIIAKGYADMVAFGQPFITNPDLVYRMQNGIELTEVGYDAHATFYGGAEEGYTDYPFAAEQAIENNQSAIA